MLIMDNSKELSRKKFEATSKKLPGQQNVETAWFQACQEQLKKRHQTANLGLIPPSEKTRTSLAKLKYKLMSALMFKLKKGCLKQSRSKKMKLQTKSELVAVQ